MRLRRLLGAGGLGLLMSACGGSPAAAPTVLPTAAAGPGPTSAGATTAPSVAPSPAARPSPTTAAQAASQAGTVYVGNTDGQGVYIRKTPSMADRLRAYPDGTPLTIAGADVDGDGQHWHHVTTPDGLEGYVPSMYTVDSPP